MHTKIGQTVTRKIRFTIQKKELAPLPPRRAIWQRNNDLSPFCSNTLHDTCDEQMVMSAKIKKLVKRIEKRKLIFPMASSDDDDDEMN